MQTAQCLHSLLNYETAVFGLLFALCKVKKTAVILWQFTASSFSVVC